MVVLIACPVGATSIFTANLTGSQETPPNASPANGFGTFVLNEAMTQLPFNITYAGLIGGDLVGAHFHEAPVGGRRTDCTRPEPRGSDDSQWIVHRDLDECRR
jgi:hypothetical protein